jgi:hypothetical protein
LVHSGGAKFNLLYDVRVETELPALVTGERICVPASADETVKGLGRFFTRLGSAKDRESELRGIEAAVFVAREALEQQGRRDAVVNAAGGPVVQIEGMALDVGANGSVKLVLSEALKKVPADVRAAPVDVACGDEFHLALALPNVPDDTGEKT